MQGHSDAEMLLQVERARAKAADLLNSPQWSLNCVKPCDTYVMDLGNKVAAKGVYNTPLPLDTVFRFISNTETMYGLDENLLEHRLLHQKKGEYAVEYMRYKGFWPVADRDFVVCSAAMQEASRAIFTSSSCDYPCLEVKGVVRGDIHVVACLLDAINETTTRITYLSSTDLKGDIPDFFKKKLLEEQGETAYEIANAILKYGK